MRLGVSLATLGVAISVTVVAVGRPLRARPVLGARRAARRGHLRRPTRPRCSRCCASCPLPKRLTGTLEAESGLNDAPTVVLVTLISTGALSEDGPLVIAGIIVFELVAGVLIGLAVGFGGAWVMRRAALPSSGLYPLAVHLPDPPRVRRRRGRARVRLRGRLRRRAGARQLRAAAPRRDPVVRRGDRLAGPDRAVRDARSAALAGPDHARDRRPGDRRRPGADLRGAPAVGARVRPGAADAPARAGVPLLGRAARRGADRAHHDPAGRGGRRRRAALRHRLRDGRDLHRC